MPGKPGSASPPPSAATIAMARLLRQLRDRAGDDTPVSAKLAEGDAASSDGRTPAPDPPSQGPLTPPG
jgi:hypothetical protein